MMTSESLLTCATRSVNECSIVWQRRMDLHHQSTVLETAAFLLSYADRKVLFVTRLQARSTYTLQLRVRGHADFEARLTETLTAVPS